MFWDELGNVLGWILSKEMIWKWLEQIWIRAAIDLKTERTLSIVMPWPGFSFWFLGFLYWVKSNLYNPIKVQLN